MPSLRDSSLALRAVATLALSACPPKGGSTSEASSAPSTGISGSSTMSEQTTGSTDASTPTGSITTGEDTSCERTCDRPITVEGPIEILGDDPPGQYACVEQVDGDLAFFGTGWDQKQFASLRRVTGSVRLQWFACHPSFLRCLESVGSLIIEEPDGCLDNLTGLDRLTTIESTLRVSDAPGLVSLVGLESLKVGPQRVEILRNSSLSSLQGLALPSDLTAISLLDLPSATDLALLAPVKNIGALTLSRLPLVSDLKDVSQLTTAARFEIGVCPGVAPEGLDALQSLSGLDSLEEVSTFVIAGNDSLMSLQGAPMLKNIQEVVIVENGNLSQSSISEFLSQNTNPNAETCSGDAGSCTCP